jgi:gas vesicle protein
MSRLERHYDDDPGSGVAWFLAGAALGAVIGMLFAPRSGTETRRYLADTAEKGRERLHETGREVREKGRDVYDRGRHLADEASELFERGRKLAGGERQGSEGLGVPPSPGEQPT